MTNELNCENIGKIKLNGNHLEIKPIEGIFYAEAKPKKGTIFGRSLIITPSRKLRSIVDSELRNIINVKPINGYKDLFTVTDGKKRKHTVFVLPTNAELVLS